MKKTKKILLLTLCVLLGTNAAFAQQRLVTATVIDNSTGEALPFVSVAIKELKTVTTTTELGTFSIEVPSPETILQFSFIGYETLEISAGKIDGTVRLESIASALDAVIVTGYQTLAREKVTGAVAMVSSTALQERYTPNIMQNMEGRVAGLVVDGDRLTIRGTGSLYAENNPLIVVDGLPIEGSWR
ncbi:MAG: carboxypeptidase-like regulatory domain-containing protein, partial [Bacteroidales bacterium]|nr:carboxypeptidase-like regulatory domain-containing protein [Bacteroidales bacterium]